MSVCGFPVAPFISETVTSFGGIIAFIIKDGNQAKLSNSMELFERPPIVKPLDSFTAFYATRMFIAAFTRALRLSLS
jgi:hypothetical protein